MLAREKWQIGTIAVLEDVFAERVHQVARYGHNEDLELGMGPDVKWVNVLDAGDVTATEVEKALRFEYETYEQEHGKPTWMHLIREEIAEAFCEGDPEKLEGELTQAAALCVSLIEHLRKTKVEEDLI